jgi:hypothetical protein
MISGHSSSMEATRTFLLWWNLTTHPWIDISIQKEWNLAKSPQTDGIWQYLEKY